MESAMVSSSTGAMNAVLHKLTYLIREDHPLRQELVKMDELLHKFATREVSDAPVKVWMRQAREVVYDIEDWVDLSIHPHRRNLKRKIDRDGIDDPINTTSHQGELGDAPEPEIADQIQDFRDRIVGAMERFKAYNLLSKLPNSDAPDIADPSSTSHPQLLHENKTPLVAISGLIDEVVNDLMNERQEELTVVSIVGNRGLGKTILAKEVYRTLQWRFQCRAFVSVRPNQSVLSILKDILTQVFPGSNDFKEKFDIQYLRWHLSDKRYFVVIDGMESMRVWKSIKCALPENDRGSKIVVMTRNSAVGKSCSSHPNGCMREINVLTEGDSKSLFLRLTFGSEERSPFGLRRAFDGILEICCGIPLAIIVAAGLFYGKSSLLAQPEILEKYISTAVNRFPTLQGMRKILHISYADLTLAVKSCFLYLSVFPENYTIKRDRLIRRWIAEGFIPKRGEGRSWEIGEMYFDELVKRRLIQPVFDYDDGPTMGCTVHGEIRDFLVCLSSEENFATWDEDIRCMPRDVIRRFSLDYSSQEEDSTLASSTVHLSKVRSLTAFGNVGGRPNRILDLRFLRVLDLEDADNLKNLDLVGIGRLVLLRYLGLGGSGIDRLPEEIGELEHLETLDLRRTPLRTLPASILGLRKLVSLLGEGVVLPIGIGDMQDLEEISTIDGGRSFSSMAEMLNKSKRLRMLGVRWKDLYILGATAVTLRQSFMSFLNKLAKSNLRSLILDDYPVGGAIANRRSKLLQHCPVGDCYPAGWLLDLLLDSWEVPPRHLRRFELKISGQLRVVPHKMASLVNLTHLRVSIYEVETEGLRVLGDLPNLVLLKLKSGGHDAPGRCTISSAGFRCLVEFLYTCAFGVMGLRFKPGAMPQLRRLRIEFRASEKNGDFDFGIQHLCCLKLVHAAIECRDARVLEAAEAAIREQVSRNPSSPVLELSREFSRR